MDHFTYKDGALYAEEVAVSDIAEAVGTPFYCYSTATIERHFRVFSEALEGLPALVCFAVKANSNIAVIRTLARMGAGADVVSGGELTRALTAGVPAERIVFSGVGKTRKEMADALAAGVLQINVESEPELEQLDQVARERGVRAPVALRVNPDVDAHTHAKISTGRREDKFGIEWTRAHEVYSRGANMAGIEMTGLAVHIGSQLTELEPFRDAFVRLGDLVTMLRADGHDIRRLDLGGGLGIPYDSMDTPSPEQYGAVVKETVSQLNCELLFEPGRVILGNAGILVARVLYVKDGETRRFAIIDAAMNDLMRPSLYDAHHEVVPVAEPQTGAERLRYDVVGPICETGDTLARERDLAKLAAGDLVAIRTAGAYGAAMSSTYNSRPLVPEVLVKDGAFAVVRGRMEVSEFLARESQPDWLANEVPGGGAGGSS